MIMSDISVSGLGSFVLLVFISCFFGFVIFFLAIRFSLLNFEARPKAGKTNGLMVRAALIPFLIGICGLIVLKIFEKQNEMQLLFDRYLAIAMVGMSLVLAILYLIMGLKRIEKAH